MRVGIQPAPGSGLATMAATGQLSRLTRHWSGFREAGHELRYFSSLPDDPDWIADVRRPRKRLGLVSATRRPLYDPLAYYGCDVIRATSLMGALPAIVARCALLIPFVVSYGGDYEAIARIHGRPAWKWRWLRTLAFRFASAVIVPNPVMAETLRRLYPRTRIVHVPNWVDCEMFKPRPKPVNYPHKQVLYVGRLVKEKNLPRLARVCVENDWDLTCIGDGPFRVTAECLGPKPWEELPFWHSQADVFCLPSYTEGQPKALLEAMASGLPCAVSSGVTGIRIPGGCRFPPEDEGAMADTIRYLLEHGEGYRDWNRQVALDYDIHKVLPREIAVVESVVR